MCNQLFYAFGECERNVIHDFIVAAILLSLGA
jgi:hypothetical protein